MTSEKELMQNDDDEPIIDEQVRKDLQILSARLQDLRERFMKIVHKINNDSAGFDDQLSEEDEATDDESNDEMSVDEEDNDSTSSDDEEVVQKSKMHIKMQTILIQSILQRKFRHYGYLKHITQYPKILKYLLNDNPNCVNIPLRYLEPFIKDRINKNPTGKIYDKINEQIQDIRRHYLKSHQ